MFKTAYYLTDIIYNGIILYVLVFRKNYLGIVYFEAEEVPLFVGGNF